MRGILIAIAVIVCFVPSSQGQTKTAESLQPLFSAREGNTLNDKLNRILNDGNEAFIARNYDLAIQYYDQGIRLAPSARAFWVNKAQTLLARATAAFGTSIYLTDESFKKARLEAARRDLREAAEAAGQGVELMNARAVPSETAYLNAYELHRIGILGLRAKALSLVATEVDESYALPAVEALHAYIEAETDIERKLEGQLRAGRMLLILGKFMDAFAEYEKVLLSNPDNVPAILGAAVTLINLGDLTNDGAYRNQGIDYLARFVLVASDKHPLRGSAEEALNYLKPAASIRPPSEVAISNKSPTAEPNPPDKSTKGLTPASERPPIAGSSVESGGPRLDGGVLNGRAISLPKPPYPAIAKFARAKGTVLVQLTIDEQGNVIYARAVSGHPLLMAVCVAVAHRAKFTPTKLSGQPVRVGGVITYNFVPE